MHRGRVRRRLVLAAFLALLVPAAAHAQAHVTGQWQTLGASIPINPIHVALLFTGRILVVAGSENDPRFTDYRAAVFDPDTQITQLQSIPWDLFCNAMSQLPDGSILTTGGNKQYNPFRGIRTTTIFDPVTERFRQVEDMADGRWYPSNVLLADGRTATFGGWLEFSGGTNSSVEIYDLVSGWSPPYEAPFAPVLYPWLHLLPDGTVFYAGSSPDTRVFDPATLSWTGVIATTHFTAGRQYGYSVLLPLDPADGYRPRIMIAGGNNTATDTAEIIDLSQPSPQWRPLPSMSAPRVDGTAVLLPTGKVLVVGGSRQHNAESTAVLTAETFDPLTETWSSAGGIAFPRLYHTVGLLLPDGRVWIAGSNPVEGTYESRMEMYSPPYLFTPDGRPAARPTIAAAASVLGYSAAFRVQTPDAENIRAVVLARLGSSTHAFDFDQRVVRLNFSAGAGAVTAVSPPSPGLAPPGYYMLFIIDSAGVPSVAHIAQLAPGLDDQPPDSSITSPGSDASILPGEAVSFVGAGLDPDGGVASYAWSFPGGTPSYSAAAAPGPVRWDTPGTYVVSFAATDITGLTDPTPATRTITVRPTPAPRPTALSPSSHPARGADFVLSVTGDDFAPTSRVRWNGQDRPTTFVSVGLLQATIAAADVGMAGTAEVTVFTPPPSGGGSAVLTFTVMPSFPLTVTRAGAGAVRGTPGGIECGPICTGWYSATATVTLVATPGPGRTFIGWRGACAGTQPSCTVSVGADTLVAALFTEGGIDFDGDGFTDVAIHDRHSGAWHVGLSTGGTFSIAPWAEHFGTRGDAEELFVADFTGDGRADVAVHDRQSGGWWIGRSTGGSFAIEYWAASFGDRGPAAENVFVADFTGDGRADVAIHDRQSGDWWIGRSTGGGFAIELWAGAFGTHADTEELFVADFTGDGRADVAVHDRQSGGWWIGRSTGVGLAIELWAAGFGNRGPTVEAVFVGDFTGDGRTDVAVHDRPSGGWWIGRSTGTSFSVEPWAGGFGTRGDAEEIFVGDFTGDGRADVAVHARDTGAWWIGRSTGTSLALEPWATGFGTGGETEAGFIGDFTGDGRVDVAIQNTGSGAWWVGRSTGTGLVIEPWVSGFGTRGSDESVLAGAR